MLNQFHSINQAAEILVGTVGTPQERLANGFKAFRRATMVSNDWPVALWQKYNGICDTLLAGGTWQKTIDSMELKAASECATQISKAMKDLAVAVGTRQKPLGDSASGNYPTVRFRHVGEL
jgi:hypothetical protein